MKWVHGVWHRMVVPKHIVISWLGVQGRLQTKEGLFRSGVSQNSTCCICGFADETHSHLFFECVCSKQVMTQILNWIGVNYWKRTVPQWLMWITRSYKGLKTRKEVLIASVHALLTSYHVWMVRNTASWQQQVTSIHYTMNSIQHIVRHRVLYCLPQKCSAVDRIWIKNL